MLGTSLGPYSIDRELGSGGMGRVYAATLSRDSAGLSAGQIVALKVIHPHLLESEGFFRRFLREAEIGERIDHPNVVRTYLCDQVVLDGESHCFLVMEHVEGQTLRALMAELGQVPEELCRHVAREICGGLTAIHASGAIHRDLKPDNVLITPDHQVKVMDLGVARLVDEQIRLSKTGAFVGSIEYAAPEQFKAVGPDERTDLYALGVLLYEIATATNPFRGGAVHEVLERVCTFTPRRIGDLNPQLSPYFEEVVHTLLEKSPGDRFRSAAELLQVLDAGEDAGWWRERALALREQTGRPLRRIRVPRETAVYGRERDIARLRDRFERASHGDGQVVLVEGEAGIGKSRLVDELLARLRRDGEDPHFLFGSYPPGGAAAASGALSTAFREHFGEQSSAPYLRETPRLAPAFDAVLRGDAPPVGVEALSTEALGTCFVHALRALAAERPTVLLLDDLHFAPEESRDMLATLAQAIPGHRALLIAASRPREGATWSGEVVRLEHVSHVVLDRLGAKDLAKLLEDSFRSPLLADRLGMQIARKSDGNPFFVFEILRGLREGNFITQDEDGTWVTTGAIGEISIPSSVLELVGERVADLDEEDRNLLDVAACWGYEFDPLLLGDVLGLARIPLLRRMGQIERKHRLVRAVGRRYVFDHHQVQEALYESLSELLREEYHAALAEAHEARVGERAGGDTAVDLCEHYLRGGRGDDARRHLDAAIEHLSGAYLHADVVALIDRALAVPGLFEGADRVRLQLRLAPPLRSLGRSSSLIEIALDARDAVGDDEQLHVAIEVLRGEGLGAASRNAEALAVFDGVIAEASRLGMRREEAAARTGRGTALHLTGRIDDAREEHLRAVEIAKEIGDEPSTIRALIAVGHTWGFQGHPNKGQPYHQEAADRARAAGLRSLEGAAEMGLGIALRGQGLLDEARAAYERAQIAQRDAGNRAAERAIANNLGNAYLAAADYRRAGPHLRRALALCEELGDRAGESIVIGNIGAIRLRHGELGEARACFQRQLELCRELETPASEAFALGRLGMVALYRGELAAGLDCGRAALAVCERIGDVAGQANQLHLLAMVQLERAFFEGALSLLRRQIGLLRESGNRRQEGWSQRLLHVVLRAMGDMDGAVAAVEEALAIGREFDAAELISGALVDRSEIRLEAGDPDGARAGLEEALAIADASGLATTRVAARCLLARLPGGAVDEAARALADVGSSITPGAAMHAHYQLWRACGDLSHLARAKETADALLARAPEADRERMRAHAPVLRDVFRAADEAGL